MNKNFQFLHTMIRVRDLQKSIDFYTRIFCMKLLHQQDFEAGRFTLAFIRIWRWEKQHCLELTYNWDQKESYDPGNGFGHLALGISGIYYICEQVKAQGAQVVREAGPMKHCTTVIAFVKTPMITWLNLLKWVQNSAL